MQTIRQQIIDLLSLQEMDARQISGQVGIQEKEVVEHLSHIARSLAVKDEKLTIRPAECLLCGYLFEKRQRFTRPSRCPRCKKSHLQSPGFYIT
jgi:predicted Zn-ribbon and HTH transcriptional regulator